MYSEIILENIFFYSIRGGGAVIFATAQFNNLVPVVLI